MDLALWIIVGVVGVLMYLGLGCFVAKGIQRLNQGFPRSAALLDILCWPLIVAVVAMFAFLILVAVLFVLALCLAIAGILIGLALILIAGVLALALGFVVTCVVVIIVSSPLKGLSVLMRVVTKRSVL